MAGNFRKGAEAAKEASKAGNFAKTEFFSLDDNEKAVVRFLTDADEWIVVDQHQMILTKPKPDGFEGNWPEKMGAVCRKDPAFEYGECYICENIVDGKKVKRPAARSWALACLREEVQEEGRVVGYKDATRTVTRKKQGGKDDETEEITEKSIVVVNLGYKNFFGILQGFAGFYGTVTDRDYVIQRSGSSTDTTYSIIPLDPIDVPVKKDGQPIGESARLGKFHPNWSERYATDLDLERIVSERASAEFYARFFDPRFVVVGEGDERKVVATGSSAAPPPSNDVDPDRMAAIANRVKSYGPAADAQVAPAAPAEAPASAAPVAPAAEANGGPPPAPAPAPPAQPEAAPAGAMRDFE